MKLSIILTVENDTCLKQSLQSILCQTTQDYELLIICSDIHDESYTYCLSIAGRYPHVNIWINNDLDFSCLENVGIQHAFGDYVMFMRSGDELITSDALSQLMIPMKQHPDIIMYPYQIMDEHRNIIHFSDFQMLSNTYTIGHVFLQMLHQNEFDVNVSLRVYRRDMLRKYHLYFFKGVQVKDIYYTLQVCTYLHDFVILPTPLYRFTKKKVINDAWFTDILFLIDIFKKERESMEYDMGTFVMEYLADLYAAGLLIYGEKEHQDKQLWNQIDHYQSILHYHRLLNVRRISYLHCLYGIKGMVFLLKLYNQIHKDICIGGSYGKSCSLYY